MFLGARARQIPKPSRETWNEFTSIRAFEHKLTPRAGQRVVLETAPNPRLPIG
jgi:hypothetical protein